MGNSSWRRAQRSDATDRSLGSTCLCLSVARSRYFARTTLLAVLTGFFVPAGQGAGELVDLATLNGGNQAFASANDVGADGSVVVGSVQVPVGYHTINYFPFRWTPGSGMVSLGGPLNKSSANAVNADGSVIVGDVYPSVFRWTQATGIVNLGTLNGGTYTHATGVSADGSVVVGSAHAIEKYANPNPLSQRHLSAESRYMTPNSAFEHTAVSALRLLAVPSSLRSSAATQRKRSASPPLRRRNPQEPIIC